MYAHAMRKWSLIKLLMLLFLPIMILLFYCQGGVNAMYLSTPRQQIQQKLHYNPYYSPHQNTQNFQGVEEKRYYNNENSNRFLSESNNNNNNNIYNNRKVNNHDSKNGDEMDGDSGEEEKKKNLLLIKSDRNLIRSDNNLSNINNNNNNSSSSSYVNESNPHKIQKDLWIKRMKEKKDRHENFRHMFSRTAASPSSPPSRSIINQTEYENLNSISSPSSNRHISSNLNINSSSYRNRRDSPSRLKTNTSNNNNNNNNKNNNNKLKRFRNKNKLHIKRHTNKSKRRRNRRYCSAQDPATLAYEAPTVFSGKIHSMSSDRSSNFSVTFKIQETIKKQNGFTLPTQVRLQFIKSNKIECDIFKEEFKIVGNVNQDFEQRKIYYLFVNQINVHNFTILGQPIEDSKNVTNAIKKGISKTYGQNATIVDLKYEVKNISSTREQQIDVNSKIRLVCKIKGRPTPKVTWYFNKRPIRELSGYTVETQRRRSVLTLKHAGVSNDGEYECRARNKVSKRASKTIKIRVNQKRDNSPNEEISGKSACDVQEYCHNGGTCVLFKQLSEYSCQCHENYTGHRCQHKVPTDSNSTFSNNNYDDDRLMPMTQKMETSIPNDYYAEDVE